MKIIRSFLLVIPLVLLIAGCGAAPSDVTPLPESMKGYELYSWQEGNQWRFSLLIGTNRLKTVDEIKAADTLLPDVDTLIARLKKVPAGQYVTWTSRETVAFPPDGILRQVEQVCTDQGLTLSIAK
jgi:hypothetical protein